MHVSLQKLILASVVGPQDPSWWPYLTLQDL